MSLPHHHLQSPFKPQPSLAVPRKPHFRAYKRRRLKPARCFQNPFQSQFDGLVSSLASQFSPDSILPSAVAFASGVALTVSQRFAGPGDFGEWVLFSSPTPFNRFVLLRCPSLSFEGGELLEDVNERLVKEDRHFVRLTTGKLQVKIGEDDGKGIASEPKLEYQRLCIGTEDGGVISLDWPANLDLKEERGLDSTLLLVPGTAEGSMDEEVKAFVLDALNRGFFPVVMNPRGCAGSPLTTARLFTAADSDDISSAVQFISKARPWTTLMAVGWGLGANMLTKYLAEVGEGTPLTAATCINNPFDLEEVTRSSPHHGAISEKLLGGLKDILRANKELFQGKTKGFDVEKALSTSSAREFDRAISMVSHEFEAIEEFYSRSSTRDLVGNVKVPLLFIQNDDETVPPFSIPRGKIAENPYTSLLLCLCAPSGRNGNRSALSWCRHLTVEWLAAVELGLLKGRHPLLEDIDISINPSKGLSLVEGSASNQSTKINKFLELKEVNEYPMDKMNWMLEDSDITASRPFGTMQDQRRKMGEVNKEFQAVKDRELRQSSSIDAELVEGEEESSPDTEKGEVLQSAEVVMNMLDVTMPGALTEDKKMKVLTAVSQGETLMKAISDAVPEDVRGKMTDAVSGILHAQGAKLKLSRIQGISHLPNLTSTSKSKNEEAINDNSGSDASSKDNRSSDEMSKAENTGSEDGSMELGPEVPSSRKSSGDEETKGNAADAENSFSSEESSRQKASDSAVSFAETASGSDEGLADTQKNEQGSPDPPSEEKDTASPEATEDVQSSSTSSSEAALAEKDKNDDPKKENKSTPSVPSSSSPSFSMTEALDALTGMDDSTQVAVNSVFGVLEEMITQLEEGSDDENGDQKDSEDKEVAASSQNDESTHSDAVEVQVLEKEPYLDPHRDAKNGFDGEKLAQSSGRQDNINGLSRGKNILSTRLVNTRDLDGNNIDRLKAVNGIPFYATAKPYGGLLRDEYIRRYLFSKLPTESLDMDMTAALLLDYIPEEGQWTLLEQPGSNGDSTDSEATMEEIGVDGIVQAKSSEGVELTDTFIETPYIVMDTGEEQPPVREYATKNGMEEQANIDNLGSFQLMHFIRKIILDTLKVEVDRRTNVEDKKQMEPSLALDCELVANAVCSAIGCNEELALDLEGKTFSIERSHEKIGTLHGEIIVGALSSAVQRTDYLKKLLPLGVVVGSCLAALEEFFDVVSAHDTVEVKGDITDKANISGRSDMEEEVLPEKAQNKSQMEINEEEIIHPPYKRTKSDDLLQNGDRNDEKKETHNQQVMVGVVTAALGTSALLVRQQEMGQANESVEISSQSFKGEGTQDKELGEVSSEKDPSNLVTSLAEKAMSVAAPVVPTKEDGEVDQERLVAMLAELGQRGGLLKLVGKVALLWGGLRGAMSFTDKLISFLRIAERPLIQRIVAFVGMVLVLWSPIFVPLLPTLVQSWMSNRPFRIAELACIVGLYAAVIVLVRLWGRRIRGYEKPFTQYGLDVSSLQKVQDLLKGLVGGVMLIVAIQVLNSSIGCISFCWPPGLPSPSLDAIAKLNAYSKIILLAGQGFATAIAVAIVEELLFRAWLPAEIATDLGHHWGTILSGLAFSLLQRPLSAVPGLWLLSLSLSGIRQRNGGSLAVPIGLRAGVIATNYILQTGGFLTSTPNVPLWIIGTHPFQPFSGIVGLSFSLMMAVILYPKEQTTKKKLTRPIRE